MIDIFIIILPVFALIFLGFTLGKLGFVSDKTLVDASRYVLYIALPSLIFLSLSQANISETFNRNYLIVYTVVGVTSILFAICLYYFLGRFSFFEAVFFSMGIVCSNNAFIGFPILSKALPEIAIEAFSMSLLIENIVVLLIIFVLLEVANTKQNTSKKSLAIALIKNILCHPLILALFTGILLNLIQTPIPSVAADTLSLLSDSSAPVSLLVIGANLATIKLKEIDFKIASGIAVGKLILFPAFALMLSQLIKVIPKDLSAGMVIIASAPTFSLYTVIGIKYGYNKICSSVQIITVTVAIFTMPLWIYLLTVFLM